jgi:hypothetical protein
MFSSFQCCVVLGGEDARSLSIGCLYEHSLDVYTDLKRSVERRLPACIEVNRLLADMCGSQQSADCESAWPPVLLSGVLEKGPT